MRPNKLAGAKRRRGANPEAELRLKSGVPVLRVESIRRAKITMSGLWSGDHVVRLSESRCF